MEDSKILRVWKHVVKKGDRDYDRLREFCHLSKNLYNHANYLVRQEFLRTGNRIRYEELDKILKADREYPDYAAMPTAQCAQQTLRMLSENLKSFINSSSDYRKHPEKYKGRPKMPGYLKKDGCYELILTNQNCRLKGDVLHFPT